MKNFVLLIITMAMTPGVFAERSWKIYMKNAMQKVYEGEYTQSLKDFDRAVLLANKDDDKAWAMARKAISLQFLRQYENAGNEKVKILRLKGLGADQKVLYAASAIAYYTYAGDYKKAKLLSGNLYALRLTADSAIHSLAYYTAFLLKRMKKQEAAEKILSSALEKTISKSKFARDMQKITKYMGQKKYGAIITEFSDSYIKNVDRQNQFYYYWRRGLAAYRGGQYINTVKSMDNCLKCNPRYASAEYYKIRAGNIINLHRFKPVFRKHKQ